MRVRKKTAIDVVNAKAEEIVYCSRCNYAMHRSSKDIRALYSGNQFLFTPDQFTDRLNAQLGSFSSYWVMTKELDDSLGSVIYDGGTAIAAAMFMHRDRSDSSEFVLDKDSTDVSDIMVGFYSTDSKAVAYTVLAMVMTCDPSLDFDEARAVGAEIIGAGESVDYYYKNGLRYLFVAYGNQYYLQIAIAANFN